MKKKKNHHNRDNRKTISFSFPSIATTNENEPSFFHLFVRSFADAYIYRYRHVSAYTLTNLFALEMRRISSFFHFVGKYRIEKMPTLSSKSWFPKSRPSWAKKRLKIKLILSSTGNNEKSTSIHMTTEKQYDRRKPQAANKKWRNERKNVAAARRKGFVQREKKCPFTMKAKPAATSSSADRNGRKFCADFIWGSIRLIVWLYVLLCLGLALHCLSYINMYSAGRIPCKWVRVDGNVCMRTSSKIGIICFAIRWSI